MKHQKTEWVSIGIPKKLYKRIAKAIVFLGFPSVPEYVRVKTQNALARDEEKIIVEMDYNSKVS